MKKNATRVALTAAAAVAAIVVPAAAASAADVGDGQLPCNRGEICFTYDGYFTYQKQFWYAADHAGYYFTRVSDGTKTSYPLQNDAWGIWNRDTVCDVMVVDEISFWPDDTQTFAKNDTSWRALNSDVQNQNDRHDRVNCS